MQESDIYYLEEFLDAISLDTDKDYKFTMLEVYN